MPRDGSGIMSWPANGNAVPNTPIDSGKYNAFRADLLSDLNAARPVPAGGTGANTSVGGNDNLNAQSGNIASATATDLASSTGTSVTITGTAVITSFTALPAGAIRHLTFAAAATLTHNATSLILPGAANIVTAAGDTASAQSLGGGNWRIRGYQRAAQVPNSSSSTETLSNKSLVDASTNIVDEADATKKVKFQVSGVTTATTRTLTVPDADGTVLLSTRQLLVSAFRNLKVQVISDTQVTVTADAITVEDALGNSLRRLTVNVTAAISAAGLNGLDTGAEAANTWYHVWVISDGTNTAALLSLSATAPTIPGAYTYRTRVGAVRNDAAANLWRTLQYGRRAQLVIGTNPVTVPAIASGNSGSPTTPTWTAVAIGSFVPATAVAIRGTMVNAQSDNNRAILAPNNSYGAWNSANGAPVGNGNNGITGSTLYTNEQFNLVLESTNIYYASSQGSTVVLLNGWEDNI
ncbi:hypothetical protein EN943_15655 [Mesorhizobium sp. M7A.F.Ca.US.006.01.1.1]|uniref:hypothetical protein n=1 Tax=Mesorhizobium sp. M7A.F.Ca.US.006.01.1.1 TaxID=2496707 RepID=UPI000FCBD0FD|nr:hypothetical protein [Mesorhizobium sp. M7A.F.Ca.US.006.01.1.1]RUZ76915.1 hypothetical protein EN943_15655 [Mesorhizobium sp. M7A.F.Ca.US.006.01.1.1]